MRLVVGAVREDEDLAGEAGLDDAVGSGRGQVVGAAGQSAGESQGCAVRPCDGLHVHPVAAVLHRVVRLVRADAVGADEGAVNDDEVALTQPDESLVQAGRPRRQDVQGLVDVPPGRRRGDPETHRELREHLVLP